jgi:hypothetical protein
MTSVPTFCGEEGRAPIRLPSPVLGSIVHSSVPVEAHRVAVWGFHSKPTLFSGTSVGWKPPVVPVMGSNQKIWLPQSVRVGGVAA